MVGGAPDQLMKRFRYSDADNKNAHTSTIIINCVFISRYYAHSKTFGEAKWTAGREDT